MLPVGSAAAVTKALSVLPAVLIVLFIGLMWPLGLLCNGERRRYVTELSRQAMGVVGQLLHGPEAASLPTGSQDPDGRPRDRDPYTDHA
jgi:hypothetical protein